MKRIALLIASSLLAAGAMAVQIYEPFSYPPGSNLAGQGGWVLTAGTTSPQIATNALATPGLQPASEGNSLIFGGTQMEVHRGMKNLLGGEWNGEYWYSLAFNVNSLGSLTTAGGFIAAFTQSNSPGFYGGRLYLRKDVSGNGYNIGVSKASDAAPDIAWSGTVFQVGQTNFVVCRYHTGDDASDTLLWINPDPSTYGAVSAPPPDVTASGGVNPLTAVSIMVLRQGSAAEGPGSIFVDTVRVEGGWPHVTPIPLTMSVALTNNTDVFLSWGGVQNVLLQQTANLNPPITWTNLNGGLTGNASIRNYTITNAVSDTLPKFYRLIAWFPE